MSRYLVNVACKMYSSWPEYTGAINHLIRSCAMQPGMVDYSILLGSDNRDITCPAPLLGARESVAWGRSKKCLIDVSN